MQKLVFQTEKLRRLTLFGIITLLILLISLFVMLQTAYIQTKITNYITKELSSKLKADIHINNVNLSLFKGFKIQGILIKDIQKDTMLYINSLYILPSRIPADFNNLSLKSVELNDLYFDLHELKKDSLNLDYMIDAMISEEDTSASEDFHLRIDNFTIHNSIFKYKEIDSTSSPGMDFEDMEFTEIEVNIKNIDILNYNIKTQIKKIKLKEKSGLVVENISTASNLITPDKIKIKDLKIVTDKSHFEFDSLNLNYPKRYYFSPYKTDLKLQAVFKPGSFINYSDMEIFLQDSLKQNGTLYFSGNINGKYKDINFTDFYLNAENIFSIKTNSHIKNFPDWENLEFDINISELKANPEKISDFTLPGKSEPLINLPDKLKKINTVTYKGKTAGTSASFSSKGTVFGDFGKITIDASAQKDTASYTNISGKIYGDNIDLGTAVNDLNFGKLSFKQDFKLSYLKSNKIKATTKGNISTFIYKNHEYNNIDLYTSVNGKQIDSLNIRINQPELIAEISGNADFNEKIPNIHILCGIPYADLYAMKLSKTPASLKTKIFGNFKGLNIDDFEGNISLIKPLFFTEDSIQTKISALKLTGKYLTKDSVKTKFINLKSDFIDADLKSTGSISQSLNSLNILFQNIFKEKQEEEKNIKNISGNDFLDFEIIIKKPEIITKFFQQDIQISKQSKIFGYYQSNKNKFNVSFNSNLLKYKNIVVKDFYIISYTRNNTLFAGTGGSSVRPNETFYAENVNFGSEIKKDTVNFNLIWNNFKDSTNYSADISGTVNIIKRRNNKLSYRCKFSDSEITLNNILWKFKNAAVTIDSSKINISDLRIKHNDEEVYIDGNISKYQGDILFATFKNLNLSNFQPLISDKIFFNGKLNGFSTFADLYKNPLVFTKDSVVNLSINNMNFGNFYLKSFWNDSKNNIHVNAYNLKGKRRFMNDTIYGDYNPSTKELNFTADVRSLLLKTFKNYYESFVDFNKSAFLTGKINIKGKINKPDVTGNFKIKQTTAYIKYLNTYNNMGELAFSFDKKNIIINRTKILPENGSGTAFISGRIHHRNFTNFALDIDLQVNNYELLKIIPTDSSYYYGQAYGSGNINFSGPLQDIFLDANLSTERNTNIFIPISSDKTYNEEAGILTFKTDTSLHYNIKKGTNTQAADVSGFSMNMKLDVTPDAKIQILPGANSGDIYTQGEGGLSLILEKNGDFNVIGTYNISKGNYQFNIENIIRKDFTITEGSTIDWFGNPRDALINIKAAYTLNNVSLSDLTQNPEEIRRAQIKCEINIVGKLLNPEFKLNVIFPDNLTEYSAKINNLAENELNEQFLSLLLLGIFQPLPGINQENIAGNQVTGEILSKQLNSLLKKIKYVDLNLNYKSGNTNYSDEYKVGISKKLLNDRIEVKGNLGIGGQETQQTDATNYIGEFEVEAKLNKKGTIRGKVYNKANDKIENDGNYTQGLGFIWRRDFDYLFHRKNKQKKDTVPKKTEINDSIK